MSPEPIRLPGLEARVADQGRRVLGQVSDPDEADVLGRLALWLADVSAEAALAQNSPEVDGPVGHSADTNSPAVEPPR
ncbi:MAG TPA: hypothetical protein VGE81_08050 [Candidatus Limnocylindrales bacterium]|jgi:hypothetical protein